MPMCRPILGSILIVLTISLPCRASENHPQPLKDALALETAMEAAIQEAEPSIACILVSRSQVYQEWFGEELLPENSGKLGLFDPNKAELQISPRNRSQVEELKKEISRRFKLITEFGGVERELKKKFDLANPDYVPESFGSGVVIDKSGLILTNYHVVRDARKVYVRLPGSKGSYADIHAADPRSDLAVLRLLNPPEGLQSLKRGDAGKLRKGQFVVSLANPFAAGFRDGSPSASWGIISNLRRRLPINPSLDETVRSRWPLHYFSTLLQMDARLNLGCSGGALINLNGEMIGLTTALAALSGGEAAGGFAIPLDPDINQIIDELSKGREVEYGFLGIKFSPAETLTGDRVRIGGVVYNSPASRGALKLNDMILAVNEVPIHDNDDLMVSIGKHLAGTETTIKIRSAEGQERMVKVKLVKSYQPTDKIIAANRPAFVRGLRVEYTSVLLQRDPFSRDKISEGVYVREVQPNSAADREHLQNQIILQVNNHVVNDPEEFYREAERAEKDLPLEMTILNRDEGAPVRKVRLN